MKTSGGEWLRILVKVVFILCYIAFMWASIHKVAYFFGNFEAQNGVNAGSYALAAAFDITALVTTIGVMFFRKSMPKYVQIILWTFIVGIVIYTFFINWEYDYHFQGMDLVLQPTGETTPLFDAQGNLHYIPVMRQNTTLLMVNPLLASGFTIFALIYSVVAEFFGAKPPSVEEFQARLDYLNSVKEIQKQVEEAEAEARSKKPGLIATAKGMALEVKEAVQEVTAKTEKEEANQVSFKGDARTEDMLDKTVAYLQQNPEAPDEMLAVCLGLQRPSSARFWRLKAEGILTQSRKDDEGGKPVFDSLFSGSTSEGPVTENVPVVRESKSGDLQTGERVPLDPSFDAIHEEKRHTEDTVSEDAKTPDRMAPNLASLNYAPDIIEVLKRYPGVYTSWLSQGVKSVTIHEIVQVTKQPKKRVQYQVGKALKRTPRGADKILIGSVIDWLKTAPIPEQIAEHVLPQEVHHNGHHEEASVEDNPFEYPEYQPATH